jgi:hypothetical protein
MISALQTSTHPFLMSLGSTFGSGNDQVNVTEKSFHPHVDSIHMQTYGYALSVESLYQTQTAFEEAIESILITLHDRTCT